MAQRHRNIDNALRVSPKQIRMATIAVVVLGLAVLAWAFFASGDRARAAELRRVRPGDPSQLVVDRLGAPPATCPVGSLEHLRTQFSDEFAPAALDDALDRMREATAQRWVYPSRRAAARCTPRSGDTEVGVGREGQVLWLVRATGRTPVQLADVFRPAPAS